MYAKKTKITTLFNNSSPSHQRCTILESIRWMQTAYALLCQLHSFFFKQQHCLWTAFNWGFFIDFFCRLHQYASRWQQITYSWVSHLSFTQMICSGTLIHLGMKQLAVFMNESVNYSLKQVVHKHFQSLWMTVPCPTKLCLGKNELAKSNCQYCVYVYMATAF